MMAQERLTGRTRHREEKRWLRSSLLALQVEVAGTYGGDYDVCTGFDTPTYKSVFWRDATTVDIFELFSRERMVVV